MLIVLSLSWGQWGGAVNVGFSVGLGSSLLFQPGLQTAFSLELACVVLEGWSEIICFV